MVYAAKQLTQDAVLLRDIDIDVEGCWRRRNTCLPQAALPHSPTSWNNSIWSLTFLVSILLFFVSKSIAIQRRLIELSFSCKRVLRLAFFVTSPKAGSPFLILAIDLRDLDAFPSYPIRFVVSSRKFRVQHLVVATVRYNLSLLRKQRRPIQHREERQCFCPSSPPLRRPF